jgi:1-aminocyclopropane-1-carboxylate deaminase/D-cysteine desulfhydrase-like pyridoxal-dependent ACC family enzyme
MEGVDGSIRASPSDRGVSRRFPKVDTCCVAEAEFQRQKLGRDKYTVSVAEQSESVMVGLTSLDSVVGARGSTGTYPGYVVEISKKDLKIVRSNYIRYKYQDVNS